MPLIRKIVKGVGSGIGLAREAYEHNKQQKLDAQAQEQAHGQSSASDIPQPPPPYLDLPAEEADKLVASGQAVPVNEYIPLKAEEEKHDTVDHDSSADEAETMWDLDEAAEYADPPAYDVVHEESGQEEEDTNQKLVRQVLAIAKPPPSNIPQLRAPVVIPQRRPRAKGRGFVRAYAPVLAESGIDQDSFLVFIKNFSKAAAPSKALSAVFIAAQVVGNVPEMTAMIVSLSVSIAAGTAIELQRRYKANSYLDEINEKYFKPRGKYAVIIAFKPDQERPLEVGDFDPNRIVAQFSESSGSKARDTARNLRNFSGKSYGEVDIGETAPLVFPILDHAAKDPEGSKFKRANKFMQDYYDRRAQAQYSADNPNSALSAAEPVKFRSRYSDPNHPASSGSLISLLTGGHVNPDKYRTQRRNWKRQARGRQPLKPNEPRGRIARLLREDVLYLMIVDMPTEEELAVAREQLHIMKQQKAENSWWNVAKNMASSSHDTQQRQHPNPSLPSPPSQPSQPSPPAPHAPYGQ